MTQSLASTVSKTMVCAMSVAGRTGHEFAHQRLVRRLGKMHGDVPAPVRPLERSDRRLALEEDFGEHVDNALGRVLVADRKAGAVGRGVDVIGNPKKAGGGRGGVRSNLRNLRISEKYSALEP